MIKSKHCGRRLVILSPEKITELVAEFQAAPFSIHRRAKELGVNASSLGYHLRGGKVHKVLLTPAWKRQAKAALKAGNYVDAMRALETAVKLLSKEQRV